MIAAVAGVALALQPAAAASPAATPPASAIAAAVAASGLPPLTGDAFRFTDIAAGGRGATLFEARRTGGGATRRTIMTLAATQAGWQVQSRETRRLAGETFDYLSARIDAAITKGVATAAACADGSDYLSERAAATAVRSLRGCDDDNPNVAIARLFGVRETP